MKTNYTGFIGDVSDEQQRALDAFRKEVTAMGCTNPPYDDPYLLRFLRARKFDLTKTMIMWNNFIKWRKDNNVDEISSYQFPEIADVKKFYPHGYFRTDKQGRPIYIERIGNLKIKELFKVTTEERLIKYYIQSYERLLHEMFPACSQAAGHRVEQCVTILDLKGSSTSIMSKQVWDFIKLASNLGQDNYPENLGRMFIVNAPFLFSGIWLVIKPWLDDKTKAKITIIGSKFEPQLLELIDAANLPDFLGGQAKVTEYGEYMNIQQGPWCDAKQISSVSIETGTSNLFIENIQEGSQASIEGVQSNSMGLIKK